MELTWKDVRDINTSISKMKKRLANNIMRKVTPLMWESGYVKDNFKNMDDYTPLKLFVFKDSKEYKLKNSYLIEQFQGFTENRTVIVDAYGGGLANSNLDTLPIEDLIKLWAWVKSDNYKQLKKKAA